MTARAFDSSDRGRSTEEAAVELSVDDATDSDSKASRRGPRSPPSSGHAASSSRGGSGSVAAARHRAARYDSTLLRVLWAGDGDGGGDLRRFRRPEAICSSSEELLADGRRPGSGSGNGDGDGGSRVGATRLSDARRDWNSCCADAGSAGTVGAAGAAVGAMGSAAAAVRSSWVASDARWRSSARASVAALSTS